MAQEIERKFLVNGNHYKAEAYQSTRITQGYLCSVPERTVRVRVRADKGYITVKGAGDEGGVKRFEWEMEIPVADARALLKLAEPGVIDKCRYLVRAADGVHIWEVDEFYADNEGLTMAEVELDDENEPFSKPEWIEKEVTGDLRYYNSALSKNPYKNWK